MKNGRREIVYYFATLILVSAAVVFVYRLWEWNFFEIPFIYSSDGITNLVGIETLIREGGWGFSSQYLGAPYGQVVYDGAQSAYLPILIKKILILFSKNIVLIMNLSYLAGFAIIACVSLAVLRKLRINAIVSVALSVLYACVPYHFLRGANHYELSFYVTVPVAVYYIVSIMYGEREILNRDKHYLNLDNLKWFLAMIIVGLNGVYYAFFSCFFFCVAAVYILINKKQLRRLRDAFLSVVMITASVVAGYLPTVIYSMTHGKNEGGVIRSAAALEKYGLRLDQLILPITGHRIPILAKLKNMYNTNYTVNENDTASLGLLFTFAFIVLFLYLWKKHDHDKPYLRELACLNLAALIYASSGGVILLQGLISPMIRCGNRISIFIAFFACICLGVMLTDFFQRKRMKTWNMAAVMFFLLCIGVLDNTKESYVDVEENRLHIESDRDFVESIDGIENGEGMIYQMPFMEYPENGPIVDLGDYSHEVGYLFSDSLRWSYGVFRGRTGSSIMKELGNEAMSEETIQKITRMGYTGIYIDKRGYEEEVFNTIIKCIEGILGEKPVVSKLGDKYYYSLKHYISDNNIVVDYVAIEFGEGIYGQETNGNDVWRWIEAEGGFMLYNFSESVQKGTLVIETNPSQTGLYSFEVAGDDEEGSFDVSMEDSTCKMHVSLQPGANYFEFSTDCPPVQSDDPRELCLRMEDILFEA